MGLVRKLLNLTVTAGSGVILFIFFETESVSYFALMGDNKNANIRISQHIQHARSRLIQDLMNITK